LLWKSITVPGALELR